jgi:hypothetical protein
VGLDLSIPAMGLGHKTSHVPADVLVSGQLGMGDGGLELGTGGDCLGWPWQCREASFGTAQVLRTAWSGPFLEASRPCFLSAESRGEPGCSPAPHSFCPWKTTAAPILPDCSWRDVAMRHSHLFLLWVSFLWNIAHLETPPDFRKGAVFPKYLQCASPWAGSFRCLFFTEAFQQCYVAILQ